MAKAKQTEPVENKTVRKIEQLAESVAKAARRKADPAFEVPTRALSNVRFHPKRKIIELMDGHQSRQLFNIAQAKAFMQTLQVAAVCKGLIETNDSASIRAVFYNLKVPIKGTHELIFAAQEESDPIIEDLEVTIAALREELGVFAATKGSMVGPMIMIDNGDTINLGAVGSGGWAVPSIVEPDIIQFRSHTAKFVLVIEKDTVWSRFNKDRFWERHNCMIIHGGGQPPRGVRRLCWRMHNELKLPVYVLVDNDPWGYYIYSVLKQGSINLAFESQRMAIPDARFIGMSSFDAEEFDIPESAFDPLEKDDVRRAEQIMKYPWFVDKKPWQREIQAMLDKGVKLELEALSSKSFRFITETYIPEKIRKQDWLD